MRTQFWKHYRKEEFRVLRVLLGFESKNRGERERESKTGKTDARKEVFKLPTRYEGPPREHLEFKQAAYINGN